MVKGQPSFDQGTFLQHLQKGKEYFDQNALQKAREELEAARQMRPGDEKVLNMLGMTCFKLDLLPEAEEMYMALAARNPDIYTLQSNLGLIQLKLEKLDQAKESLIRALELQPTNPKAHFYLGLLFEKQEKWEDALAHFGHARADKMASKMQSKIEEEKKKGRQEILPFQILEVFSGAEKEADKIYESGAPANQVEEEPFELPPASEVEDPGFAEALAQEEAAINESETTLKIPNQSVQEAMEIIHGKADDSTPMPRFGNEVIPFPPPGLMPEEDLNSATPEVSDVFDEPGVHQESDASEPIDRMTPKPSSVEGNASFFLMEEMAGDISTFLAQSRTEEETTEEVLYEESPEVSVVSTSSSEEKSAEEELFESPIPSPEQVENQTQDIGSESLFEKEVAPEIDVLTPSSDLQPEEKAEEPVKVDDVQPASVQYGDEIPVPDETPAPQVFEPVAATAHANLDQFSRERFYVQPLIGSDRFLLIDPHLLEVIISEKLICRMGTISSYTGNLQFSSWQSSYGETVPLIQASGSGILFMADRRKEVFILSLNNETIFIEANHLLVAQSALNVETEIFREQPPARDIAVLKISGRGTIALTCQSKPLTLKVHENLPINIPSDALMAWSGNLKAELLRDEELRRVMMAPEEHAGFLRFTGSGDVVVEQGSLWGDRRGKKA